MQYMLIIPTLTDVLRRIDVSTGLVGAIAGASDFASMFMTPGAAPLLSPPSGYDSILTRPDLPLVCPIIASVLMTPGATSPHSCRNLTCSS